jgi:hypothetical protein
MTVIKYFLLVPTLQNYNKFSFSMINYQRLTLKYCISVKNVQKKHINADKTRTMLSSKFKIIYWKS